MEMLLKTLGALLALGYCVSPPLFGTPLSSPGTGTSKPTKPSTPEAPIKTDFSLSGSWLGLETWENRGDLLFDVAPWGLGFRTMVLTSGKLGAENGGETVEHNSMNGGLYHKQSLSRLLWGPLQFKGLEARTKNIWLRSPPFPDYREATLADLDESAGPQKPPQAYLALGTPTSGPLRLYGSALLDPTLPLDSQNGPVVTVGSEYRGRGASLGRIEGLYTYRTLQERRVDTWFSESPPQPSQGMSFGALGWALLSPTLALAADGALSHAPLRGYGGYGNGGLRWGSDPLRLSLSYEASSPGFMDWQGKGLSQKARGALRAEYYWKRGTFFRWTIQFDEPFVTGPLEKTQTEIRYYWGAPKTSAPLFNPLSGGFSLSSDGREPPATENRASLLFDCSLFTVAFQGSTGLSWSDPQDRKEPISLPYWTDRSVWKAFTGSGALSYRGSWWYLKGTLGLTQGSSKPPLWDESAYLSLRLGSSQFSVKVSENPPSPVPTIDISWQLHYRFVLSRPPWESPY
jgi:hypothetical protein